MIVDDQRERLIAQGLREGKTDAWQALYDAYAERVWRGVARLLGPQRAEVADVVQETMMAAARSARTYDPSRGSLWPWLWGIAYNHVAMHLRKADQQQRLAKAIAALTANSDQGLRWFEGKDPSPPAAASAAEMAELVRAALTSLSADHALVLTARYLDGDSVADIARQERSTESAIRSKLARARQAFREVFAKHAVYAT